MVSVEHSVDEDGVLWLELNRPDKLNAMNTEMADSLRGHLERAAADSTVRSVVLTGRGRAFCAGGDISTMGQLTSEEAVARLRGRARLIQAMSALPQPLIAAVNGVAAGGGFALTLASDVVIADPSAYFTQSFLELGLAPDMGFTYAIVRQVGIRRALSIVLGEQRLDAGEAHRLGLVSEVSPPDELIPCARQYASRLASRSPHAVTATKRMIRQALFSDIASAMDQEALAYGIAVGTDQHRRAVEQFRSAHPRAGGPPTAPEEAADGSGHGRSG